MENYVTRGHVDFPSTFTKDGNDLTSPEDVLKFEDNYAEPHTGFPGVTIRSDYIAYVPAFLKQRLLQAEFRIQTCISYS